MHSNRLLRKSRTGMIRKVSARQLTGADEGNLAPVNKSKNVNADGKNKNVSAFICDIIDNRA